MKDKQKNILSLFLTMLKIGLFTFGGGYAMLALLENELISKKKWIEKDEFLNMVAIAESTPGPIAINSATYIGYKRAGFLGSLSATIGICIPSFVIIYLISLFFDLFLSLSYVQYAFKGIQVCVVFLIFRAGLKMFKGIEKTLLSIIIFSLTIICMLAFSLFSVSFSAVFYILISGAVGIFAYLIGLLTKKRKESEK
ncbi:MAG: chromate transporter [Ruminococcaceae bacterium]|nr:chromate transporter [Oscillospiraceae bacterium]